MSVQLTDSYENLLDRAVEQMSLGKPQEAIDLTMRVVDRLSKLSVETLARKPAQRTILMSAWEMTTEFLRWDKQFDQAIAVCERLHASHPDLSLVPLRLNMLRVERGEVDLGVAGLREAVERDGSAYAWTILGLQLQELGQIDQAEACYKKAISGAENNESAADAYDSLFDLYKAQHRVNQALEAWNMVAVLEPDRVEKNHALYRWLIQEGEIAHAQSYLKRERNPVWREFFAGLIDWQSGQTERARRHWQAAVNSDITDLAQNEWLEAALRLGDTEAVLSEIEPRLTGGGPRLTGGGPRLTGGGPRLTGGGPLLPAALMVGGLAWALTGDIDSAQRVLSDVVQILERRWPSRTKIEGWWSLVTDVISNPETRAALAGYFEPNEAAP